MNYTVVKVSFSISTKFFRIILQYLQKNIGKLKKSLENKEFSTINQKTSHRVFTENCSKLSWNILYLRFS